MQRVFDKEYLLDELFVFDDAVVDEIVTTARWTSTNRIIFLDPKDNTYWQAYYRVGLTEYQDERPWEYVETVTANQVEEREVLVKQWVII